MRQSSRKTATTSSTSTRLSFQKWLKNHHAADFAISVMSCVETIHAIAITCSFRESLPLKTV